MSHKDKQKAYNSAYYKANLEREQGRHRDYHRANKLRLNIEAKAWRKVNKERIKAYNKAYREADVEKEKARQKAWRKVNPEKNRGYKRKRWALKHKTQVEAINEKIVYLRDGWKCQHCKQRVYKRFKYPNPMSASLDHIIPLSEGGTHTYDNLQLVHLSCNASKHASILPQGEQLRIF